MGMLVEYSDLHLETQNVLHLFIQEKNEAEDFSIITSSAGGKILKAKYRCHVRKIRFTIWTGYCLVSIWKGTQLQKPSQNCSCPGLCHVNNSIKSTLLGG